MFKLALFIKTLNSVEFSFVCYGLSPVGELDKQRTGPAEASGGSE